ncbi:phospholipid-transporting ATPase ABCA3-like [Brevipalpus obovatus]|uniref:phospholipid-transporting ATPase ABCA3-like n=1 Tax=Brevipalpus obovatus TaxID=246614 RepID=UPI003D9ECD7B
MVAAFVFQLKALMRKDLILRRRSWLGTLLELILPILLAWFACRIAQEFIPKDPTHRFVNVSYPMFIPGPVFYTPRSDEIDDIIANLTEICPGANFSFKESEEEMIKTIGTDETNFYGIVFNESNPKYNFTIRDQTERAVSPRALRGNSLFWWWGFAAIHRAMAINELGTKPETRRYYNPTISSFRPRDPNPADIADTSLKILVCMVSVGNLMNVVIAAKRVAEEKEKGSKELIRMMGVADYTYWIAQSINYLPLFNIQAIFISWIAYTKLGDNILADTSFLGLLLLLPALFISNLLIGFTVTTFINEVILVLIATIVTITPGVIEVMKLSSGSLLSVPVMFLSPVALTYNWLMEINGFAIEGPPGWAAPIVLPLSWAFFISFLLYVDAVCPWQPGTPKPWCFLFKSHSDIVDYSIIENGSFTDSNSSVPEARPAKAKIICSNVNKTFSSFGSTKKAVEEFSLKILQNQITVLLGHNGAGKTTLMNMITGFIGPTSGHIFVNGFDVQRDTLPARRSLALCPQHECLYEYLTTRENLELCSNIRGNNPEIVSSALKLLQLDKKSATLASKLSGGMRRRLQLGMALVTDADTIILDEPTSGLDPETRRTVWDYLLSLRKEKTILISTHFMEEADALANQIVIVSGGRLKCSGSPMYLKKKFGSGYAIKMGKSIFQKEEAFKFFSVHFPKSSLMCETAEEITINLHVSEKEENSPTFYAQLANFCDALDFKKQELGISAYSVTTATLEDVFMKIAVNEGMVSQDRVTIAQVKEASLKEVSNAFAYPKSGPVKSFIKVFHGLVNKRMIWLLRDISFIMSTFFIPVMFITYFGWRSNIDVVGTTKPHLFIERYISPDAYVPDFSDLKILFSSSGSSELLDCFFKVTGNYPFQIVNTTSTVEEFQNASGLDQWYFDKLFLYAIEDHGSPEDVVLYRSTSYAYSLPIAINNFFNVLHCYDKDHIQLFNITEHPFPGLPSAASFYFKSLLKRVIVGFFLPISMSMIFASFYINPSKEIMTKAKLIQIMAGANEFIFWISNLIFDLQYYLFVAFVLMIILVFYMSDILLSVEIIGVLYLLFATSGFTGIPFAYLLTFSKLNFSTGYRALCIIYSTFGSVMAMYIIGSIDVITLGNLFPSLYDFHWFMRALPPVGLASGLGKIMKVSRTIQVCPVMRVYFQKFREVPNFEINFQFIREYCLDGLQPNYLKIVFPELMSMLSLGLISLVSTLLISFFHNKLSKFLSTLTNILMTPSPARDEVLDEDVIAEKNSTNQLVENHEFSREALIAHDIVKDYHNIKLSRFRAVDKVSFTVHKNECFGLLGVNGAGKTTMFSMLTGDIAMTEGDAYVGELHILRNIDEYRSKISYCPQEDALLELLTPRETLMLFGKLKGIPCKEMEKNVDLMIASTDLKKFQNTLNRNLSGGNKRKLALAIAAIGGPSVIFLDEPTTGVDPASRRKIWATLIGLRESGKSSIVLTSHSMDECEALCNRIAIMAKGQIRCLGSSTHLKSKYGQGFTLIIKMKEGSDFSSSCSSFSSSSYSNVHELIGTLFPSAKLHDLHGTTVQYHLTDPKLRWGEMFRCMKQVQEECEIESFYITDTSIEQIFLSMKHLPTSKIRIPICDTSHIYVGSSGSTPST